MEFVRNVMGFLKWFSRLVFIIKWNVFVLLYVIYTFFFGDLTLTNAFTIFFLANLYALPIYVLIARRVNIHSDLLIIGAGSVLLVGHFTSVYLPIFAWMGAMAFLFQKELYTLINLIRNQISKKAK